ncbi:Selenocysteine-specific translation elongation factor [Giardia muris]|uniref:Selenocysteine-specific translation elongation factor n=1 Tax=Giardia muris TaxID=5742 RepID=A0A4Z1SLN0_GIAMU|nr:Selenocysteine-specific translation elongation factor [Giardia muris]|eukprot:TNJ26440.1 Selenocysteine-specific translation elongation factor [Giardia muris]
MSEAEERVKNLNIVFIGHVDAGKSTISGHLMFEKGGLDVRTLEKFEQQAKALNRESWKYAFAMDTSEEEREKGKTVECARASFLTASKRITIIDAPGHKGFVHNMIAGTAQADVAILVVSARKNEFESGFERGGQTSEHALIAYVCGVKNIIVLINKLDDPTVEYSEERYNTIVTQIQRFLLGVGYAQNRIHFIPISGYTGENLASRENLDPRLSAWYSGPCFLELLDTIKIPKRDTKGPLCACVSGRYKESGAFILAKLEQGRMESGMSYVCLPNNKVFEVVGIEDEEGEALTTTRAGDNVRVRIRDEAWEYFHEGSVICSLGPETHVTVTNTFQLKLLIVTRDDRIVLSKGFNCVLHLNLEQVGCTVIRLLALIDPKTGKVRADCLVEEAGEKKIVPPTHARSGDNCICEVRTDSPICVSEFSKLLALGRAILRREAETVAIGVITKTKPMRQ